MTMPKDFTFSQSSLQSYLNCQFQFILKYVRGLDWPSAYLDPWNPAEIERQSGVRFHQLVHNYFLGVPEALLIKQAQADRNPKMPDWFANFLKSSITTVEGNPYPEFAVITRIEAITYSAKFDMLVMDEQKIHIFDWKTSSQTPKADWLRKRVQTQLYPLLASSHHQKQFPGQKVPSVEFTYWEASYPETPIHFSFDQTTLEAAERFIANLANEIISKPLDSFTKTSHAKSCSFCLYRTYCQRAAVNSEELELEDDLLFTGQDLVEMPEEK